MKIFGTDGIRAVIGESLLNPDFILKLGYAVGNVLVEKKRGPIIIGKDTRISGYMIESALEAGLSAAGTEIILTGPLSTPAISCLVTRHDAAGAFVISASHNPYEYNGIKIFNAMGEKLSEEDETKIEDLIHNFRNTNIPCVTTKRLGKALRLTDAANHYTRYLISCLGHKVNLDSMKIVFDGANGSAYSIGPSLLQNLGADVVTVGCSPDGLNINDKCGALYPETMKQVADKTSADIAFAMDGDADRITMYCKGNIYDGDDILYILAQHEHLKGNLIQGVVGTELSNYGLELALKKLSLLFHRSKVGDKNVYKEMKERNLMLGGEPSGHIILRNYSKTGDGLLAAIKILEMMQVTGKSIAEFMVGMTKYPNRSKNILCKSHKEAIDIAQHSKVTKYTKDKCAKNGLPRIIVRPSGTENLLRIYVEAEHIADANNSLLEMESLIKNDT